MPSDDASSTTRSRIAEAGTPRRSCRRLDRRRRRPQPMGGHHQPRHEPVDAGGRLPAFRVLRPFHRVRDGVRRKRRRRSWAGDHVALRRHRLRPVRSGRPFMVVARLGFPDRRRDGHHPTGRRRISGEEWHEGVCGGGEGGLRQRVRVRSGGVDEVAASVIPLPTPTNFDYAADRCAIVGSGSSRCWTAACRRLRLWPVANTRSPT